jgi:hypothetical protein
MQIHIDPVEMLDPQKQHSKAELQGVLAQLVISWLFWRINVPGGNWLRILV